MPQTILIVEDDNNINEVVSEYMKSAGYVVLSCTHGGDALEVLRRNSVIDLFILDIMLPEVTGLELLKEIRTMEKYQKTPVVMLTALGDEATQLLSFEEMADDYVTKPFSPKVLVKRVGVLLRRGGSHCKALQYGNIRIDHDSFEVWDAGEKIPLTLREFELLSVLIKNAGKVLSRQQLLNYAWGYDYFGDERVVNVHIKNLRKKLKSDVIATVTGVGYKFEGER